MPEDDIPETPPEMYPGFTLSNEPRGVANEYKVVLTIQDGDTPLSDEDPTRRTVTCYVQSQNKTNEMTAQGYVSEVSGALGINIVGYAVEVA